MKTFRSSAIGLIAIVVLGPSAFAMIRSPYPRQPTSPDTIMVATNDTDLADDTNNWIPASLLGGDESRQSQ